jgi:SAM-dependent methyltransferase
VAVNGITILALYPTLTLQVVKTKAYFHSLKIQKNPNPWRSPRHSRRGKCVGGTTRRVVGVDLCLEMVEKARHNALLLRLNNVEFVSAGIEKLPLTGASVDVVISNGVFSLCPDKPSVLAEAFRVLRPGGRLQMADILLEEGVTPEVVARKGSWSA